MAEPKKKTTQEQFIDNTLKSLDSMNEARGEFYKADKRLNEATTSIIESYAELAKKNPEQMFGLQPTEREKYLVQEIIVPYMNEISKMEDTGGVELDENGDVTGSNAGWAALLASDNAPKIIDSLLKHVDKEKKFYKEIGEDVIGGVGKLVKGFKEWWDSDVKVVAP